MTVTVGVASPMSSTRSFAPACVPVNVVDTSSPLTLTFTVTVVVVWANRVDSANEPSADGVTVTGVLPV